MIKKLFFLLIMFSALLVSNSEAQEKRLIQFSGIVLHADSLEPLPFVNIINVSRNYKGTYTDMRGFFSLVVNVGDTIQISSIGYKKQELIIPNDLVKNTLSAIFKLKMDAINLPMIYIFPYATIEQFKQAFIKLRLPDDDLMIAQRNLDAGLLMAMSSAMAWDGTQNTRYYFQQQSEKLYWRGQERYNPLFDIVKINQFMRLLNDGKISLKNEKREEE
jgi:CarboxypepD_reg-like domain